MAHPNFADPAAGDTPRPNPNPTHAVLHRMSTKAVEIDQAPEMLTDEQLDRLRAGGLALAQAAGRALTKRRGA